MPANPEARVPRLMSVLAVLLPNTPNSELHSLASAMLNKLNGSSAALPAPIADGDPD
jgi:hypothetical protein